MADTDRFALLVALGSLTRINAGNHCYINAAMMATLWAIVSRTNFRLKDLGPKATLIVDCLLQHHDMPMDLSTQSWFADVMHSWHNPCNQGDPVEFISHLLGHLQLGGFNMKWERRVQINDITRLMDQSDALRPLTVQFAEEDPNASQYGYTSLQTMLDSWENQYGMKTALIADSPVVCIHVDRFIHQGTNAVRKCERPIHFRGSISIPFFDSDSLQIDRRGYQLISAIAHLGTDGAGHCRSLMKTWPLTDPEPVNFLLTDDGGPPARIWAEPQWFKRNVSCFWFCDCDCLDLIKWPHVQPFTADASDSSPTTDVEDVPLMRLFQAMSKT